MSGPEKRHQLELHEEQSGYAGGGEIGYADDIVMLIVCVHLWITNIDC